MLVLFVKTDGEIATGHAKSVEEIGVAAVVVVVHVVHGSNLPQIITRRASVYAGLRSGGLASECLSGFAGDSAGVTPPIFRI